MSDEYRRLSDRIARILELIERRERLLKETQDDLSVLYAELQAARLKITTLRYEGDNDHE